MSRSGKSSKPSKDKQKSKEICARNQSDLSIAEEFGADARHRDATLIGEDASKHWNSGIPGKKVGWSFVNVRPSLISQVAKILKDEPKVAKPTRKHRATGLPSGRRANAFGRSPTTDKKLLAQAKLQLADTSSREITLHADVARYFFIYI